MFKKNIIYIFLGIVLAAAAQWIFFKNPSPPPSKEPAQEVNINWVQPQSEQITIIESKSNCQLDKNTCRNKIDKKTWIEVKISPFPIEPNKQLKITVITSDDSLIPEEVDFEGLNLNMGFIRPKLKKVEGNTYETEVVLPICDEKVMEWRAMVLFSKPTHGSEKFGSKFHFTSTSN